MGNTSIIFILLTLVIGSIDREINKRGSIGSLPNLASNNFGISVMESSLNRLNSFNITRKIWQRFRKDCFQISLKIQTNLSDLICLNLH